MVCRAMHLGNFGDVDEETRMEVNSRLRSQDWSQDRSPTGLSQAGWAQAPGSCREEQHFPLPGQFIFYLFSRLFNVNFSPTQLLAA